MDLYFAFQQSAKWAKAVKSDKMASIYHGICCFFTVKLLVKHAHSYTPVSYFVLATQNKVLHVFGCLLSLRTLLAVWCFASCQLKVKYSYILSIRSLCGSLTIKAITNVKLFFFSFRLLVRRQKLKSLTFLTTCSWPHMPRLPFG